MTFTAIKKSSHTWQKFSNDYHMIQLQSQQLTKKTSQERKCSTELLEFLKGVLKNFVNFLFFNGFCRVFKNIFLLELLGECFWLYIRHIWIKQIDESYFSIKRFLQKKSKIKQKSRLTLKLGNLRIASQCSSSFAELLLSSC